MTPDTVNIKQAATLAGVTRRTIYTWMEQGLIAWVTTPTGSRRIKTASLLRETPVPSRRHPKRNRSAA